MTILDVFGGYNYTISRTNYSTPAIMHVPGRFWRRPHDKKIQENWTEFNVTDKRTSKIVFRIRCSNQLIQIETYVNGEKQELDYLTNNNLFHDITALHSLVKDPKNLHRLRQHRETYTHIQSMLQK